MWIPWFPGQPTAHWTNEVSPRSRHSCICYSPPPWLSLFQIYPLFHHFRLCAPHGPLIYLHPISYILVRYSGSGKVFKLPVQCGNSPSYCNREYTPCHQNLSWLSSWRIHSENFTYRLFTLQSYPNHSRPFRYILLYLTLTLSILQATYMLPCYHTSHRLSCAFPNSPCCQIPIGSSENSSALVAFGVHC